MFKKFLLGAGAVGAAGYLALCVVTYSEMRRNAAARDSAEKKIALARDTKEKARAVAAEKKAAAARLAMADRAGRELRSHVAGFAAPGMAATWAQAIERATVKGETVQIDTSLVSSARTRDEFKNLCQGVSTFIYKPENAGLGLSKIAVYDASGKLAVDRNSFNDACAVYG